MKDNAAAFLMYECRKFVICQNMFIPEGLPGALPGEYRLKFVVHNQVLAAVEPAEVAQYRFITISPFSMVTVGRRMIYWLML